MKTVLIENTVKNILLVLLLVLVYPSVQNSFSIENFLDRSAIGNFLAAIGLVSVIACFGNFAFTYEKVNHGKLSHRLLAHATTGLLMFLIGLSLEMTAVIVRNMVGIFPIFDMSLIVLYIASVLYDFWDLKRADL